MDNQLRDIQQKRRIFYERWGERLDLPPIKRHNINDPEPPHGIVMLVGSKSDHDMLNAIFDDWVHGRGVSFDLVPAPKKPINLP